MNFGETVFAQLIQHLPWYEFNQCVLRYHGNHKVRSFMHGSVSLHGIRSIDLSRKLARHRNVPQFPSAKALSHGIPREHRQVNAGRRQRTSRLPHLSGLRLYTHRYRQQALPKRGTWPRPETRGLCVGLNGYRSLPFHIPVGDVSKKKAAVKIHTLLNVQGSIPTFIFVTPGSVHDVNMMDSVPFEADSVYTMDRAYLDFERLYHINQLSAFFVIRSKRNTRLRRIHSASVENLSAYKQIRRSCSSATNHGWPIPILCVGCDITMPNETSDLFFLRTTSFSRQRLSPIFIDLDGRWSCSSNGSNSTFVSRRFLNITQCGQDPNLTAVSVYLLVAIVKKRLNLFRQSPHNSTNFEVNLFEKIPISQLVNETINHENEHDDDNQLNLFT